MAARAVPASSRAGAGRCGSPRARRRRRSGAAPWGSAGGTRSPTAARPATARRRSARCAGGAPSPVVVDARHGREQRTPCTGCRGRLVERLGLGQLDDAAEVHDRDAVGDLADDREVVRDEDVGQVELALQALEQVEDLRLDRDVERRDRLVADDQLGPQRERAGDADALALSARELVRVAVVVLRVQAARAPSARARGARVSPSVLWIENGCPMIWPTRLARVQRRVRILEDHLHLAPQRPHLARLRCVMSRAVEADRAGGRLEQLEHQPRGRRLAAARLADDAERLAAVDAERDVLDGVHDAAAAREHAQADGEVLRQVLDLDERVAAGGARCAPTPQADAASRSAQSPRLSLGVEVAGVGVAALDRLRAAAGSCRTASKRCGQRGWNGQPGGRLMTDGGEPSIARRCVEPWLELGIDSSSPQVYGCCAASKTSCAGPCSIAPGRRT